mmetsp:Transcript_19723/g.29213  ORF Transcript_19723/g.29213 Transcript_19723/m.29213 type:complete len:175 (+) Transcript_19723:98-622(+)
MSALPDNVKAVISRLSVQDQVVIRSYIAGMRDELKELKVKSEHADDDDPHAHYHGHEKCTADHGHQDHEHKEDHHSHEHHGEKKCTEDHSHDHKHDDHKCDGGHAHEHKHSSHDHSHDHKKKEEHHDHEHAHKHHEEKEDEDMPAWKKQALDADPNAAPFGGSWNVESSMDATK